MTAIGCRSRALLSNTVQRPSPVKAKTPAQRVHDALFNNIHNSVISVLLLLALIDAGWHVLDWAVLRAVWHSDSAARCEAAAGACWAIIGEKYRLILFGTYPYDQQWRPLLAVALILGVTVASGFRRLWSHALLWTWAALVPVVLVLMLGGSFGLSPTGTHLWGGLPLTLIMALVTVAFGLPGAVLLALGRRSRLPVIKALSIGVTEITRGLPLLVVLFTAAILLPMFLPPMLRIEKFVAAQVAMVIYFAAYAADIVRGGLQAVPVGQYEAAEAAGLNYGQQMRKVILPQGLRIVIPALMNDIIRAFKNTTFVSILGMFDILGATNAATQDPAWIRFAPEAYLFVFLLYFIFCFSMSRYSISLERHLARGRNY